MASIAAKAEMSLSKTCKKLGITLEGKRWLDLALDPFKDLNMPTNGFPDAVEIPSVVETIHDSIVVTVPGSVAAGNNWDCNIFVDQLYSSLPVYVTSRAFSSVYSATGQTLLGSRGGVQVRKGPANSPLTQTQSADSISLKSDVLPNADVRLIGIGLEIHNTTQELKKQGAIICYRVPNSVSKTAIATLTKDNGTSGCQPTANPLLRLTEPPLTASQAIDFPQSRQWEAKDGAYIVPTLVEPTIPVLPPEKIFAEGDDGTSIYAPQILSVGAASLMYMDTTNLVSPFSLSGCFLSGLSYETSLQVNLTYYVEIFPNKDNVLRRLAQPSPSTDTAALALYGQIIDRLPVGCEVSDNFLGAFMSGVARVAGMATRYLPQIGRVIGAGMEVANVVSSAMNPLEVQRNPLYQTGISGRPIEVTTITREAPRNQPNNQNNNNRQIIPYVQTERIIRRETTTQNNGPRQARTRIAKQKHRDHISIAANPNGNKWIDNKK